MKYIILLYKKACSMNSGISSVFMRVCGIGNGYYQKITRCAVLVMFIITIYEDVHYL